MRRVRAFCEELPAVLCGGRAAAFEAVAFFRGRYVQATSDCVMRFAKDLPVIVRRVVRNRRQTVSNTHTRATAGFATGTRPREQRIEDMVMKPLVLVGALLFALPEGQPLEDEASVTSTCGVSRMSDITVTEELKCCIYPADSVATITKKLGRWEAASYDRLKLELAVIDGCAFLSSMLNLSHGGDDNDNNNNVNAGGGGAYRGEGGGGREGTLAMVPHLHMEKRSMERVVLTLQKLSAGLCDAFNDSLDFAQTQRGSDDGGRGGDGSSVVAAPPFSSMDAKLDVILSPLGKHAVDERHLDYAAVDVQSREDDRLAEESVSLPVLVAECRRLATRAAPGLRGNVNICWGEDSDLVEAATELADGCGAEEKGTAAREAGGEERPGFAVGRHRDCCTAEMLSFAVSIDLCKDLRRFVLRLRRALKTVVLEYEKGRALQKEVISLREATIHEEFIPQSAPDGEDTGAHRYRGPIFTFASVYGMVTSRELLFWQLVHRHREYLAAHATRVNTMNVYLDRLPDTSPHSSSSSGGKDRQGVVSGWIEESSDEDGTRDTVVLTSEELDDAANRSADGGAFRRWLEEVVEQSSLSKECRTTLDEAGIGYVRRDPALPLTNHLSFIKLFTRAAAVRSVLEGHAKREHPGRRRVVRSEDIGVTLIVGRRCDVRDGGQLLIPWNMDPNVLVALLSDEEAAHVPKLA